MKVIGYIYNVILTFQDSMSQSNQSCRNKICNEIQLYYWTMEHGLKAILIIDIMIKLAECLKRTNEK